MLCYMWSTQQQPPSIVPEGKNITYTTKMGYKSYKEYSAKKGLKIMTINTRSIKGKIVQFRKLVDSLDYICMSESHLKPSVRNHQVDITDMTLFRNDRPGAVGKTGGGVACYVRNHYVATTIELPELRHSSKDLECIGLSTTYPGQRQRVILIDSL